MLRLLVGCLMLGLLGACQSSPPKAASSTLLVENADPRLDWWRDARFGLFIHWGLYSMLEGEWQGSGGHAEWIRTTAQIPRDEYAKLQADFNPVHYDPDEWCRLAAAAGMKYVVITTKHHDGFCLWPSAWTEYDVDGTPSQRDLLGELAEAARKHDLRLGWYHSIMDWHHPDYLPRRGWETGRSTEGADFDRYVEFLRGQVTELLTNYGPIDVMWFDGEWESTWTSAYGQELYALCRELQPQVLVNNRVDKGRAGMAGLDKGPGFAGDFGTPEQEVPPGGLPGVDWETCMTMNRYWGWNRADTEWKSTTQLVQTLVDVASKGGNFLLNVGPQPDGRFPEQAVHRLEGMGEWMDAFGESIYGTTASPFDEAFEWGRATLKSGPGLGTCTLYLHVFDWPRTPQLVVPGLDQAGLIRAELLGTDEVYPLGWQGRDDGLQVFLPKWKPHPTTNVVKLEFQSMLPVIYRAPRFLTEADRFLETTRVDLVAGAGLEVRYTWDGSEPTMASGLANGTLVIDRSCTVRARSFRDGRAVSPIVEQVFTKLEPVAPGELPDDAEVGGLRVRRYAGAFEQVPVTDFLSTSPVDLGRHARFGAIPALAQENQCLELTGWVHAPETGLYEFQLTSDDGSLLWLGETVGADGVVVDNDGLHGAETQRGVAALQAGWHPIRLVWFNRTGSAALDLQFGLLGEAAAAPAAEALASR